jgi:hypothetical protein
MAATSIIDKLLPDDILGKDLYHYTSADGLLGILGNKVIRCSHVFYLNDIEENLNGWDFFFQVLDSYQHERESSEQFKSAVQNLFSHHKKLDYEELSNQVFHNMHEKRVYSFIFSLSLIDDDLNQWRSYAEEPFGFSLRFNFDRTFWEQQPLFRNGQNSSILLRQCVYDPKEKERKITQLLDHHFEEFSKGKNKWEDDLFFNALTLSLFFKNEKFVAEDECRLVITTALENSHTIEGAAVSLLNMRKGKSYLVPFVELMCQPSCIKQITIGPSPFKNHSLSSLIMLRNSLRAELGHIDIKHSEVPYRSW